MKKNIYTILFGILLFFLFLPMIQEKLKLKVRPLNGVTYKTEFPEFKLESINKGEYQSQLEKYISENFGFREIAIRWYNQYVWTFFNKTYNNSIAHGKGNWFYYWAGVHEYYGKELNKWYNNEEKAIENYEKNIEMMCQLRDTLKAYDIEFMSFMAPDKAFVYPEYLPDDSIRESINVFEYYDKRLNEEGFPNIEMTKWYKSMRDTMDIQIFPTIDTHWEYSSVYGYDSLFKYMNSLNNFGIPKIKYGYPVKGKKIRTYDEGLLNLIFGVINKNHEYHLDVTIDNDDSTRKPRVLFVGDSFIWALGRHLPWKDLLEDVEIWYYNSTVYKGFDLEKTDKKSINSLLSILKSDYVIFYSSGHQWHRASYDFAEEALSYFGVNDDKSREKLNRTLLQIDIEKDTAWNNKLNYFSISNGITLQEAYDIEIDNIINNNILIKDKVVVDNEAIFNHEVEKLILKWKNNPEAMQRLKEKAAKKGKPLEEVIIEDAQWVIRQQK